MPDRRLQPFREIWRKLNGLALYRLCDTDQPSARVLLGHGNGLTAATCQALAQALSRHFDVIAFDSRGHGASDVPTTFHRVNNWDRFADDQLMLSDALCKLPELAPLPLHWWSTASMPSQPYAVLIGTREPFKATNCLIPF